MTQPFYSTIDTQKSWKQELKDMDVNVHSSAAHRGWNGETAQMSISGWTGTHNAGNGRREIGLSCEKGTDAERGKPGTGYTLYDSIYRKFPA